MLHIGSLHSCQLALPAPRLPVSLWNRGVTRVSISGRQERNISSFSYISFIFPQFSSFSSSGRSFTREGPGYFTVVKEIWTNGTGNLVKKSMLLFSGNWFSKSFIYDVSSQENLIENKKGAFPFYLKRNSTNVYNLGTGSIILTYGTHYFICVNKPTNEN